MTWNWKLAKNRVSITFDIKQDGNKTLALLRAIKQSLDKDLQDDAEEEEEETEAEDEIILSYYQGLITMFWHNYEWDGNHI